MPSNYNPTRRDLIRQLGGEYLDTRKVRALLQNTGLMRLGLLTDSTLK